METTMTVDDQINDFLTRMEIRSASPNTIKAYRSDLKAFQVWDAKHPRPDLPIWDRAALYLNAIRGDYKPATVNRKCVALRRFIKHSTGADHLSEYIAPVPPKGKAHPLPDGAIDLARMLNVATKPGHRALVLLCGYMGLRISEARGVRMKDMIHDHEGVTLVVRGKGDKSRVIPVSPRVMTELMDALDAASRHPEGRLVPMSDRGAREAITRLGKLAGIDRPVSSHDLRHTFATAAYGKSKDIRAVQEALGHSSVETTQIYTGVTMSGLRDAMDF